MDQEPPREPSAPNDEPKLLDRLQPGAALLQIVKRQFDPTQREVRRTDTPRKREVQEFPARSEPSRQATPWYQVRFGTNEQFVITVLLAVCSFLPFGPSAKLGLSGTVLVMVVWLAITAPTKIRTGPIWVKVLFSSLILSIIGAPFLTYIVPRIMEVDAGPILVITNRVVFTKVVDGKEAIFANIFFANRSGSQYTVSDYGAAGFDPVISDEATLTSVFDAMRSNLDAMAKAGLAAPTTVAPYSSDNFTAFPADMPHLIFLSAQDSKLFRAGQRAFYFEGYLIATRGAERRVTSYCGYALYSFSDLTIHNCPPLPEDKR
jgi:hypothetical protein